MHSLIAHIDLGSDQFAHGLGERHANRGHREVLRHIVRDGRRHRRGARRDVPDSPAGDGPVVGVAVRRCVRTPARRGVMPRIAGVGRTVARYAFVGLLEVEQSMVVLVVRCLRVVHVPDQQPAPREGSVEADRLTILDEEIFRRRAGQA